MNCERIQAELSEHLDGRPLGVPARLHLESCAECDEFLASSRLIAASYRSQIDRGLRRLRQGETPLPLRPRRPLIGGLALAVVVILVWAGLPKPRVEVVVPTVLAEPPCVRLYDDVPLAAEPPVSLVWIPEAFLPVRLEEDLLPPSSEMDVLAVLPPSLRF